jgi:hypothetical protein
MRAFPCGVFTEFSAALPERAVSEQLASYLQRPRVEDVMAITSVHCPVLHTTVKRVTDLEGEVVRVICPEYDEPTEGCRLKKTAYQGGPLAQLLERAEEGTLNRRTVHCDLL